MQKTGNNFYEKTVNSFTNAKNRFYKCSEQIRIYSKQDVQSANFINVETDVINAKKKKKKKRLDYCEIQT